ncbi:MAG: DUF3592 domain-containing protein [Planctomycetaceae bacterium]|nr:DUF3592 domain-containing protein [Planctomycetales bacterium]MCB9924837.1 DUF3592 domain-containing protein [Planctomycetaceae bacterium]
MTSKSRTAPVLFLSLFIAVGSVPLVMGIRGVLQSRATLAWPQATGRIVSSGVRSEQRTSRDDDGRQRTTTYYYADVTYEYVVDGKSFTGTRITLTDGQSGSQADASATRDRYPRDAGVSVAYDPASPDQSVLEPGRWGNSGWLLLFGGVFCGVPALLLRAMLRGEPKTDRDAEQIQARTLSGVVFKERVLEWEPGSRVHLHRDHETFTTIVIASVIVGLLFGIVIGAVPAGIFFFDRFGLMFVVKAYLAVSVILALAFGISFGIAHRRRDTVIDWGFHTVRAQVGWFARQYSFNQIAGLVYLAPPPSATGEANSKQIAKIELLVDGRKYVILETEVTRQQQKHLRGKLAPILDPLSAELGVTWSEAEVKSSSASSKAVANRYQGEDRELVEAIGKVGGHVAHRDDKVYSVDLSDVEGTDGIVEIVAQFSSLQKLQMKGKGITDEAVRFLTYLGDLRVLELRSTSLTETGVRMLSNIKSLECLSLKGTRIGSAAVHPLADLPVLEELNLAYTAIDDRALEYLADCEYLDYLDLTGAAVTPDALEKLQEQLPDCSITTEEDDAA